MGSEGGRSSDVLSVAAGKAARPQDEQRPKRATATRQALSGYGKGSQVSIRDRTVMQSMIERPFTAATKERCNNWIDQLSQAFSAIFEVFNSLWIGFCSLFGKALTKSEEYPAAEVVDRKPEESELRRQHELAETERLDKEKKLAEARKLEEEKSAKAQKLALKRNSTALEKLDIIQGEFAFADDTIRNMTFSLIRQDEISPERGARKQVKILLKNYAEVRLEELKEIKKDLTSKYKKDEVDKLILKLKNAEHFANTTTFNFAKDIVDDFILILKYGKASIPKEVIEREAEVLRQRDEARIQKENEARALAEKKLEEQRKSERVRDRSNSFSSAFSLDSTIEGSVDSDSDSDASVIQSVVTSEGETSLRVLSPVTQKAVISDEIREIYTELGESITKELPKLRKKEDSEEKQGAIFFIEQSRANFNRLTSDKQLAIRTECTSFISALEAGERIIKTQKQEAKALQRALNSQHTIAYH
ncbi:MAG: hypothetical protein JXA94_07340 [Parachlamydiales bacterium]|nr:hypothetical protein [Parachlamydiales bacterium]